MLVTKYSIKRSEHKTYFFQTLRNGNVASILINLAQMKNFVKWYTVFSILMQYLIQKKLTQTENESILRPRYDERLREILET